MPPGRCADHRHWFILRVLSRSGRRAQKREAPGEHREGKLPMRQAAVLVVAEDHAIGQLFTDVLGDKGYAATCLSAPQEALTLVRAHGPHAFQLVLSHPGVPPGQDPYAFLTQLCALTHAPIVICAAVPALQYAEYQTRGFAAFLEEPFDLAELITLVAALCPLPAEQGRPTDRAL